MASPFYAQLPFLGPTTAASLAAAPGPTSVTAVYTYVDEFDATYKWSPGSVVAADGYRVISHTGGGAGRWILDGDRITLTPRGGILDDWANVGAAMNAMSGYGAIHFLNTGPLVPFRAASNIITPSNTTLYLNGATFVSTLVDNSPITFDGSIFFAFGDRTIVTTISINAAAGDTQVTLTSAAAFAIGDRILFQQGTAYWTQRVIKNKVGAVITLDRPLFRPFSAGSNALTLGVGGQNINIYGGGANFTGTGTAVVEFVCAKDCYIEGINASVTTRFGFCYDVGCRDCTFQNCSIDNNNTALTSGYLVALNENTNVIDCDSYRAGAISIYLSSSDSCRITGGIYSESLGSGLLATVDDATDTIGNQNCLIEGTTFTGAASTGVAVAGAGREITFVGVISSFNQSGFSFQPAAGGTIANCTIVGGAINGNAVFGVGVNNSKGVKIIGQAAYGHPVGVYEVNTGGEMSLVDCSIDDTSAAAATVSMIVANGAGTVCRVNGVVATANRNAQHFIRLEATAKLYIDGATRFTGNGVNDFGVLIDAGVARISGLVMTCTIGVYLNGAGAAFARIADDVDCSGCTTPYFNAGGAFNRGQVTLNGAGAVAIAFGDTNATDRCFTSYATAGGAPTGYINPGAPIVGTGFSVVGIAGDTSTINYDIH